MDMQTPDTVVIIAAGMGTRLQSDAGPPKPLLPLNGRPLILRVMDRFAEAGIPNAIVVLGHRAEEVQQGILKGHPPVNVKFVCNPNFRLSNGLSVLAAAEAVGNHPFFLSMADHVFEASLIRGLATAPIPPNGLVLAVDRKLDQIYDEDDATKVRTDGHHITAIGKTIHPFDAVDTGLFACTPNLFVRIRDAAARRPDGDCSLSDGVTALLNDRLATVHDIGDGRWQDVDTPGAANHAAKHFQDTV